MAEIFDHPKPPHRSEQHLTVDKRMWMRPARQLGLMFRHSAWMRKRHLGGLGVWRGPE